MAEISRTANAAATAPSSTRSATNGRADQRRTAATPVPLPPPTTTFLAPHAAPRPTGSRSTIASNDPRLASLARADCINLDHRGRTSGRHDLVDAFQLPDTATPLHLHTRYKERLSSSKAIRCVGTGPDMVQLRPGELRAIRPSRPHAIKAAERLPRPVDHIARWVRKLIARAAAPRASRRPDTRSISNLHLGLAELGDLSRPPGVLPADL